MMMLKRLGIAIIIMLLFASPARAATTSVGDISEQLICQCGCTLTLANCSHGECMSREGMTALIAQKLSQGQSDKEIIAFFVDQYGEQVLASPPKRGFNLMAWVTPFVAILAGAAVITFALRAWVRRGESSPTTTAAGVEEGDEKYQHQLEEELKGFTERGFR